MSQITYANKVALSPQPDVADINKVTDDDMNMIKSAHNDTDDNVNKLMPVVLYNDSTGSNETITLSDSAINYNYIEIFYYVVNDYYVYKSVKVCQPNYKYITLDNVDFVDNTLIFTTKTMTINGTSITNVRNRRFTIAESQNWTPYGSVAAIYINKVIGYK